MKAFLFISPVASQTGSERQYSLVARNAPLEIALERFSEKTGINVTFLSNTTAHQSVYCVIEAASPEEILTCLLKDTELDFIRLSSGTYAIVTGTRKPAKFGALNGQVISSRNHTPIGYAHILINGLNYGTATDEAGRFIFPPLLPGKYQVTATHIGYSAWQDTIQISAQNTLSLSIPLSPKTVSLEPIVIDIPAYEPSAALAYQEVNATSLLEQSPSFGAVNTLQNLAVNSGIQFSHATSDLHVQGGTAGEHQVLLDGSPIFLPQQLGGFWGPFNPQTIEQIRIHKSGFGAKIGSSQSGVMEITHRLKPAKGEHVTVQFAPLTLNILTGLNPRLKHQKQLNFMAAFRQDLWSIYTPRSINSGLKAWSTLDTFPTIAPLYLGGALDVETSLSLDNLNPESTPAFSFRDYHAVANFQWSPLQRLNASFYHGDAGITSEDNNDNLDISDKYQWYNSTGQIKFETTFGSRFLATAQLRSSQYTLNHKYELVDRLNIYGNNDQIELQKLIETPIHDKNKISESALSVGLSFAQSPNHFIEGGAEIVLSKSTFQLVASHTLSLIDKVLSDNADSLEANTRFFQDDFRSTRAIIYIEDTWQLASHVHLIPGIRWTWLAGHSASFTEPRLALIWDTSPSTNTAWRNRLAIGLYHQFTTQHDLSTANLGAVLPSLRFWIPLRPDVLPPKSIHFSATSSLQQVERWNLQIESFVKLQPRTLVLNQLASQNFSTEIDSDPASNTTSLLETSRGYAYGLALTYKKFFETLSISTTAEWTVSKRKYSEQLGNHYLSQPWIHPFRLNASTQWQPLEAFSFQATWQAIWGRQWGFRQLYYDNLTTDTQHSVYPPFNLADPQQHRLPLFHQMDLNMTYELKKYIDIQIDAGILNIYNRKNVADWRLQYNATTELFEKKPRFTIPDFAPYVRINVSW